MSDSPFGNFHLRTDIPYFSGDFVEWWIYHVECFFYHRQVLPEDKISIAEIFLVRDSLIWYQEWEWQILQSGRQITWEDFVSSIKARFKYIEVVKPHSESVGQSRLSTDEPKHIITEENDIATVEEPKAFVQNEFNENTDELSNEPDEYKGFDSEVTVTKLLVDSPHELSADKVVDYPKSNLISDVVFSFVALSSVEKFCTSSVCQNDMMILIRSPVLLQISILGMLSYYRFGERLTTLEVSKPPPLPPDIILHTYGNFCSSNSRGGSNMGYLFEGTLFSALDNVISHSTFMSLYTKHQVDNSSDILKFGRAASLGMKSLKGIYDGKGWCVALLHKKVVPRVFGFDTLMSESLKKALSISCKGGLLILRLFSGDCDFFTVFIWYPTYDIFSQRKLVLLLWLGNSDLNFWKKTFVIKIHGTLFKYCLWELRHNIPTQGRFLWTCLHVEVYITVKIAKDINMQFGMGTDIYYLYLYWLGCWNGEDIEPILGRLIRKAKKFNGVLADHKYLILGISQEWKRNVVMIWGGFCLLCDRINEQMVAINASPFLRLVCVTLVGIDTHLNSISLWTGHLDCPLDHVYTRKTKKMFKWIKGRFSSSRTIILLSTRLHSFSVKIHVFRDASDLMKKGSVLWLMKKQMQRSFLANSKSFIHIFSMFSLARPPEVATLEDENKHMKWNKSMHWLGRLEGLGIIKMNDLSKKFSLSVFGPNTTQKQEPYNNAYLTSELTSIGKVVDETLQVRPTCAILVIVCSNHFENAQK